MKYKIRNKSKTVRKFREHRNPQGHWLRAGEEIIINNPPVVANPRVFDVEEVDEKPKTSTDKEEYEEKPKNKTSKKRSKSKKEEIEYDTTRHME